MAFESPEVSSGRQIPKFDGLVVARADQDFSIRGHSETADPALVAGEGFLFNDAWHLEQLDGRIPAAGDQKFCVRGKGHGPDPEVHRLLEAAVILDIVAAGLGGIFLVSPPMAVVENLFFAAREHFPHLIFPMSVPLAR